jgi:hypothetical protein
MLYSLALLVLVSCASAVRVAPAQSDLECTTCWDIADTAIESWLELALYGGTFAGCADFCTYVLTDDFSKQNSQVENWGEGCIAICSFLGDEAFFKLLTSLDLDPVYICELLNACPVDDCGVRNNVLL